MMNCPIRVDFTLFGHGVDLERLSQDIGIPPTSTWHEGDSIQRTMLKAEFDVWRISTGYVNSIDTLDSVEVMLGLLEPAKEKLLRVSEALGLIKEFSIVLKLRNHAPSFNLPAEVVRRIADLGCSIDVDIILLPET
jgi:hypothetical protein